MMSIKMEITKMELKASMPTKVKKKLTMKTRMKRMMMMKKKCLMLKMLNSMILLMSKESLLEKNFWLVSSQQIQKMHKTK